MKDQIILKSPYDDVETVTGLTVPQFIWKQLPKWPKATCLECGITGEKYTYEEVFTMSRRFAAGLKNAGLKSGETIGFLLPNCPEFVIALLGALEAGLTVTTINPAYTSYEVIHQLKSVNAVSAVTTDLFLPLMKEAKESLGALKDVIIISANSHEGFLNYAEMQSNDDIEYLDGKNFDTTKETCLLPFSSGTTGLPKGVKLTHSGVCTNILQYCQPGISTTHSFEEGRDQEILIAVLPFFHIYGLVVIFMTGMYQGAKIVTVPKFTPEVYTKAIKQHKPTCLHLVTPLCNFIVNNPSLAAEDFKNCHSIVVAAAPTPLPLIQALLNKMGKYVHFQEGYGMTELSPIACAVNPSFKHTKLGSIGRLMPSTLAKVIDIVTEKTLGPHSEGELCIKGPQVMKGYFQNEEATRQTIDSDGFLHTGDLVIYDEDGCFFVKDRLKELIKVKGFQVAPSELDSILLSHPQIIDCAVIGVPYNDDEAPRAYIVRKVESISENDVHQFLEDKVAPFKKLKGGVQFVSAIPRAPTGKILRRELQRDYLQKYKKVVSL